MSWDPESGARGDAPGGEFRLFGPPGTGKTWQLKRQAAKWSREVGPEKIIVASFTRAAAAEISSRVNDRRINIGTLHALAYRSIDSPEIAEKHADEFSAEYPAFRLGAEAPDLDDSGLGIGVVDRGTSTEGDDLQRQYETLRARLTSRDFWPASVRNFAAVWEGWRTSHGYVDFTGMIEAALESGDPAPGRPSVGLFDEAQDFTPLELALVRSWGSRMERVLLAGDDDQTIYCHPPGTMIRTLDGDRPIEQLSSASRLISFDRRGGSEIRRRGYDCTLGTRPYVGEMLTMHVAGHVPLDATPNHRMVARWSRNGWAVYLMRRGETWRVGLTRLLREKAGGVFGPGQRARQEGADALWILSVHDVVTDALLAEDAASVAYGISKMVFHSPTSGARLLHPQGQLDAHHRNLSKHADIAGCLGAHGRLVEHPFWSPDGRQRARKAILDIPACNLVEGYMVVPVDAGSPGAAWESFTFGRRSYDGPVFSLDVRPYEHYVANGIVVHNSFKGATPEAFLDPPVDEDHKRVLRQSHRVPVAVHAAASRWVERLTRREPKVYEPRDDPGTIRVVRSTYRSPETIVEEAALAAEEGRTTMFLASCSYMIDPVKAVLRREGVPFHNPWRRRRGDWNPLSTPAANRTTASQRLLAYLRPREDAWGDDVRAWTGADLKAWTAPLQAKGFLRRGAKTLLDGLDPAAEIDDLALSDLFGALPEEDWPGLIRADLDWFEDRLLSTKRASYEFPLQIARRRGPSTLSDEPKIFVGTIHSFKGAEADRCVLFPDLSIAGRREWHAEGVARDAVVRLFYVGMTRARSDLIVCSPATSLAIDPYTLAGPGAVTL